MQQPFVTTSDREHRRVERNRLAGGSPLVVITSEQGPSESGKKSSIYGEQVCFIFDSELEALDPGVTSDFAFDLDNLEAQVRP